MKRHTWLKIDRNKNSLSHNALCMNDPMHYASVVFTNRSDTKRGNRSSQRVWVLRLHRRRTRSRRMTSGNMNIPKVLTSKPRGDETAGTAIGTMPIYTPREAITHKTTLPYGGSPRTTIYRDLPWPRRIDPSKKRRGSKWTKCAWKKKYLKKIETLSCRWFSVLVLSRSL